jgi:hypothetical protein
MNVAGLRTTERLTRSRATHGALAQPISVPSRSGAIAHGAGGHTVVVSDEGAVLAILGELMALAGQGRGEAAKHA